jgi:hypothetical protein
MTPADPWRCVRCGASRQSLPATDPQGAAVEALVAERDAARAEAAKLRAVLLGLVRGIDATGEYRSVGPCGIDQFRQALDVARKALAKTSGDDTREEVTDAPAGSRPGPREG